MALQGPGVYSMEVEGGFTVGLSYEAFCLFQFRFGGSKAGQLP